MERTARKMKMGYTDYVDQCRKALSRRNMGSFSFLYETKMKQDDIHFVWKKHMASDNIKVFVVCSVMPTSSVNKSSSPTMLWWSLIVFVHPAAVTTCFWS